MRNFIKLFFFIFCLGICLSSRADIFDEIKGCLSNPCNCGFSKQNESWISDDNTIEKLSKGSYRYPIADNINESSFYKGYANSYDPWGLCPPYNKFGSRSGCLLQYKPPITYKGASNGNWRVTCAESSKNASFTNAAIKIRMQACNAFSCFTYSDELNAAQGECKVWPTQWGIPAIRHCARIAVPRLSVDENENIIMTPDEGYQFHYLDTNGFPRPDPGILTPSGQRIFLPKICVYEDPSIWTMVSGGYMEAYRNSKADWNDTIDDRMPFHTKGPGSNPYTPKFFDVLSGSAPKNDVIENSFWYQSKEAEAYLPFDKNAVSPFNPELEGITNLGFKVDLRWKNDYENWLKDFVANKKDSLGCSFLPIGPFPPPFCKEPAVVDSTITLQRICSVYYSYDQGSGKMVVKNSESTISTPCVKSPTRNNFIFNSIRVSADEIIPVCGKDDNPSKKDCVKFHPANLSPQSVNLVNNDMLPLCANFTPASNDPPCVVTRVPNKCKSGMNCSSDKYRVIYSYETKNAKKQTYGYPSGVKGVCASNNYPCASLAGINTGEYNDIVVDLGNTQNLDKMKFIETPEFLMTGKNGQKFDVTAYLTYFGEDIDIEPGDGKILDGNSMCVYYKTTEYPDAEKAGCIPRSLPAPFKISACGIECYTPAEISTYESLQSLFHFKPKAKLEASYQGVDAQDGVTVPPDRYLAIVGVNNIGTGPYNNPNNQPNNDITRPYYIALGLLIDTIATDDTYQLPPYGGAKAYPPGSLTIFGEYKGIEMPVTALGESVKNSKYLRGLEYVNGVYKRGAKRVSAAFAEYNKCHSPLHPSAASASSKPRFDDSNCVLTKLNYSDKVNCEEFNAKNAALRCTADDVTNCTIDSSLPIIGETAGINFRNCTSNDQTKRCYEAPLSLKKEVCKPDTDPRNRVLPLFKPNELKTLEFYNYAGRAIETGDCAARNANENYNKAKCAVRDKTIIERGETLDVPPPPFCPAITTASSSTGYATWSKAEIGEDSTATCTTGYKAPPSGTQKRTCYLDENLSVVIEPIPVGSECIAMTCPAEAPKLDNGFAEWGMAEYDKTSVAKCPLGYQAPPGGFSPRKCLPNASNTDASLEPTKPSEFCYKGVDIIAGRTTSVTVSTNNNYAGISHMSPTTATDKQDYECCTSDCGLFGCCVWGWSTCSNYFNYDVYKVKVGHDSYWPIIDSAGNSSEVKWLQQAVPGSPLEYTITLKGSAINRPFSIRNLKSFAGNELVILEVKSGGNNVNCLERNPDGTSKCAAGTQSGFSVSSSADLPQATIRVVYKNGISNNLGAAVTFDLYIPQ